MILIWKRINVTKFNLLPFELPWPAQKNVRICERQTERRDKVEFGYESKSQLSKCEKEKELEQFKLLLNLKRERQRFYFLFVVEVKQHNVLLQEQPKTTTIQESLEFASFVSKKARCKFKWFFNMKKKKLAFFEFKKLPANQKQNIHFTFDLKALKWNQK